MGLPSPLFEFFLEQPIIRFDYITGKQIDLNKISEQFWKTGYLASQMQPITKQKQLLNISREYWHWTFLSV